MDEIDTYSLIDFMPMEPEVYLRLFVRQNEGMWPAQLIAVILALAGLWLAWRGRAREIGLIVGAGFAWVGYSFFLDLYTELNWAAEYAGWAFIAQGVLVAAYAFSGRLSFPGPEQRDALDITGVAFAGFALLAYPFLVPLGGRSWAGIEVFGAAPDPTALFAVGLVVAAARVRWVLLLVPVLWSLYSGATSLAMGWPLGLVTPVVALGAVVVAATKAVRAPDRDD
ncbi:MAG: DUF6064 family protein [Myxococcota bacterium]